MDAPDDWDACKKVNCNSRGGSAAGKTFKPFTADNFRENLKTLTGGVPPGEYDAHHIFPQKFRAAFAAEGIAIDDPKYGTWWERSAHRSAARAYNDAWEGFLGTAPSRSEILQFGRDLISQRYGLPFFF